MAKFRCQADLDASLHRLVHRDPRLARSFAECGPIHLRQRPDGLVGILQIILAQQVSVASAQAIWQRFEARFPRCDVEALDEASEDDLRACSLSRPKVKTVKAMISAIEAGFEFEALAALEPDDAKGRLVSLHGVGPWTADIYLLFCLGEGDVFPSGDLALQIAVGQVLGLVDRPTDKEVAKLAQDHWAPERGAAAHLFWAVYREMKSGREGVL